MNTRGKRTGRRLPALVAATVSGMLILAACGGGSDHPSAMSHQGGNDNSATMGGSPSGSVASQATPDTQNQANASEGAASQPAPGGSSSTVAGAASLPSSAGSPAPSAAGARPSTAAAGSGAHAASPK